MLSRVFKAMPVVYHPLFSAPQLPTGHRFPMQVFRRIYERLLSQQVIDSSQIHIPNMYGIDDHLKLVHCPDYLERFNTGTLSNEMKRRIGFKHITSDRCLIDRTKAEVAGTLLCARLALQHGMSCSTAGGTHHAHRSFGSGFCLVNDLAVTTEVLLSEGLASRILIVDLDVHQGDGTAAIFKELDRSNQVFTLSVHAEKNFPARKAASSLDIGLEDGCEDGEYLSTVAEALGSILPSFRPDLVLYDAGVDVHKDDELGKLSLTDEGIYRRDLLVMDSCLASGIPVAGFVGGGYHKCLDTLADRHILLHRAASRLWADHEL